MGRRFGRLRRFRLRGCHRTKQQGNEDDQACRKDETFLHRTRSRNGFSA